METGVSLNPPNATDGQVCAHFPAKNLRSFAVAGIKQSGEHFNIKKYSTVASTIVRGEKKE
jgi:hypothetical protein